MPRRRVIVRREPLSDPVYASRSSPVHQLLDGRGKKSTASRSCTAAADRGDKIKQDGSPLSRALSTTEACARGQVEARGWATYQCRSRSARTAQRARIRWLISYARARRSIRCGEAGHGNHRGFKGRELR